MSKKLVYDVGIYEKGSYTSRSDGKLTKEYRLWGSMLQRCYSHTELTRYPTYTGCSVSEEFSSFQKFAEWCNTQIGFAVSGYHLDKDIIYVGNKQYSRDSCAFVPREVNLLLRTSKASRGDYPLGTYFHKQTGKFAAHCNYGKGRITHLGLFSTAEEAYATYKGAKEAHIKTVAEQYKDSIDPRVYQALVEWKVRVDD